MTKTRTRVWVIALAAFAAIGVLVSAHGTHINQLHVTSDAWLATNSGSVGIGTTSPTQKLHVVGAVLSSGSLGSLNALDRTTGTQYALYGADGILRLWRADKGDVLTANSLGDVFLGRNDGFMPDFRWDAANQKLRVRSVIIGDIGDSPDLGLRRSHPDGVDPYYPTPAVVPAGVQVAPIYWQVWGTNGDFDADPPHYGRIAQINAFTRGTPTGTSRPGSLHFSTTPTGSADLVDRMVIRENGWIGIGTDAPYNPLHVAGPITAQGQGSLDGQLCYANNDQTNFEIRKCSSSAKYKTNVRDLAVDRAAFMKLKAREFKWRDTGRPDVGFVSEEIQATYPLLAVHDLDGTPTGVKYSQMTAVLTQIVQEQQLAIEGLQAEVEALKRSLRQR